MTTIEEKIKHKAKVRGKVFTVWKTQFGVSIFEVSKMNHPIKKVGEKHFKSQKEMLDYLMKLPLDKHITPILQ